MSPALTLFVFLLSPLAAMNGVISGANAESVGFSFTAAGDYDLLTSGDGLNSLNRLATIGADFNLALGDLSYTPSITGDVWCSQFKAKFNSVEVITGNHDTGEVRIGDSSATRSYEKFVNGCPHSLSAPITCGPLTGNCYGKEYFFDYPSPNPIARFLMISPKIYNVTGVCTANCSTSTGQTCTDQYGCWPYAQNDLHYNWTLSTIDSARAAGIRWVIVGMHKTCASAGSQSCSIGKALFNLMVSKKVDLILQGHDHAYERSKQLALNSITCAGFTTNNGYVVYSPDCIVDDGSRGFYAAGAGSVVVIQGTFGADLTRVNDTSINGGANAAQSGYFAKLMGSNTPGAGHGFIKYSVTSDRIEVQSSFSGTFADGFSIGSGPAPLSTSFTYLPPSPNPGSSVSLSALGTGGSQPYAFSWNFGDGGTATGATAAHAYSAEGDYAVVLTTTDSQGQTATSSQTVRVRVQNSITFNPTDDTYVRTDQPTTNFGSAGQIVVDNSPVKNILLKFSVSLSGQVTDARLRLYQVDASNRGGDFHTTSNSWSEATVNWNNAPAADPAIIASLGSVSLNTWYEVDVSSVVTGPGVFSFRVTSPSDDGAYYSSKEGTAGFAPQLVVSVAVSSNSPPLLTVPGSQTVNELTPLSFSVSATDDPSQTITLSATGLPSGAGFTSTPAAGSAVGTFNWTPSEAQGPGSYAVSFTATDNPGASSTGTVSITVGEVNSPPVISAPGPQSVAPNATLIFSVTATDSDTPPNTVALSAAGLVSEMSFNAVSGQFSFTPAVGQAGQTFIVSFTATDDGVPILSDSKTVSISVSKNPPSLTVPGDQTVDEGSHLTFTVSASDSNASVVVTLSASGLPAGAVFSTVTGNPVSGVFSWTPSESQAPGDYVVTFTADDGQGGVVSSSVIIHVREVNIAPTLSAPGFMSVDEGSVLSFTLTAADPDLPANNLTFSASGLPAGATLDPSTGVISWVPGEAQGPGDYSIVFTAIDNGSPLLSDTKSVTIHVNEVNAPPVVTVPPSPESVAVGNILTLTISAADADVPANNATLSASGLVSGMTFPTVLGTRSVSGAFTFTPSSSQNNMSFTVTFTATDGTLFDTKTLTINVQPNTPPTLTVPGAQTVDEGTLLTFTMSAGDSDVPAQTIALSASGLPNGATFPMATGTSSVSGTFSWISDEAQGPGDYTVTFSVTDGTDTVTATVAIHVNEVNLPPVVTVPGAQTVNEQSSLAFTVSSTDPDVPANTLALECANCALLGAAFDTATGQFSWAPTEAQGPGDYTLTFTATDNGTPVLWETKTVAVHLNEVNSAPVLTVIGAQTVDELTGLTFTVSAKDPDIPVNTLTLACSNCASLGATFNPATSQFSWTPSESQGPGDYVATFVVTDNGSPSLSDSKNVTIHVNEVNTPPALTVPGPQTAIVNKTLTFSVASIDSDIPAIAITLFAASNLVSGMSFQTVTGNPVSGTFSFTPDPSQLGMTFTVTFTSSDDGSPSASASNTVTITVVAPQSYALVISSDGKVYRYYENGTLALAARPTTVRLRQVAWHPSGSYALIVGDSATLIRYDGNQFANVSTGIPPGKTLYTVSWRPDGTYALIAGSGGTLLRYDGTTVTILQNPFKTTIRSISWHPSGTQALLVGYKGLMLVYENGLITSVSTATSSDLYAVAWNPNGLYALAGGANGAILRYDGTSVVLLPTTGLFSPTQTVTFISWNPTGTPAVIVGYAGLVLTYDGSSLTKISSPTSAALYSADWSNGSATTVGDSGTVLTYNSTTLTTVVTGVTSSLRGIDWKPS